MATFESQFSSYAKYSKPKSDGKRISLTQSDKWMRQANIFNDKVTQEDTELAFHSLHREQLNIEEYQKFIDKFAEARRLDPKEIRDKMAKCGPPITDLASKVESVIMKKVQDPSGYI